MKNVVAILPSKKHCFCCFSLIQWPKERGKITFHLNVMRWGWMWKVSVSTHYSKKRQKTSVSFWGKFVTALSDKLPSVLLHTCGFLIVWSVHRAVSGWEFVKPRCKRKKHTSHLMCTTQCIIKEAIKHRSRGSQIHTFTHISLDSRPYTNHTHAPELIPRSAFSFHLVGLFLLSWWPDMRRGLCSLLTVVLGYIRGMWGGQDP